MLKTLLNVILAIPAKTIYIQFVLACPFYIIEHSQMLAKLIQLEFEPLLNNFLFGNEIVSDEINNKTFLVIHQFIDDFKCFKN